MDASLKIFNQLSFEGGFPPSDIYEKLSIRAAWLAQGHPAATEAYGLFFRRLTSVKEWDDALCRFIKSPDKNVLEILKSSYDALEEADKIVFLHVACLFNGEPLGRATTLLDDGELQGCLGVKILAEKSLIEITAGGYIKMHSLVDQTAKAIVNQESGQRPRKRRVLWDPYEIYKLLERKATDEPTECMALHMCDMVSALHLGGYPKYKHDTLKFLKVYKHLDHIKTKLHFSSDDTYLLSSRLRLLHWDTFPLTAFPCRFGPLNLVEVSLQRSNLTSFWKETVIPNLRRLDLSCSENLEQLPDLSMAVNLEELITQGCKRLKKIPESISNLTRLTKLDVSYCDELNSYHITIRELTGRCRQIALYFYGKRVETENIKNLAIGGNIHIQMLWLDGNADHICFSTEQQASDELTKRVQQQSTHDKQLFHGLGMPMSEFHGHDWMMHRDQQVPHDHALRELHGFSSIDIIRFNYNSNGASFLCCSLSIFPCLKELNLINLNIEVIPDDICGLQFLEKLDCSGNDFETLPETMKQLPRLKYISLCNCRRLKALPELVQLEIAKLSGCMNLEALFKISHAEQDWGRWRLRELWVDDCKIIQCISDQLGRFTKLSYVDLSSNDFETLPSSIQKLSSLRTLCLNKCKKLKSIEGFPLCLKYLYAHGCESLETISFPLNHSIKHLDLSHCFCLKHEPLITQFLTEGQNEEDSPRFACFPGTEVPSYFDKIKTGASYTTGLPWPTPKLVGFDGCIVIASERGCRIQFSPLSYDYDWNYERYFHLYLQPDLFHFQDTSFHSTEEEVVKSDHLVIIRGTKNISNLINKFGIQSNLQLPKEVKSPSVKIKACGFSLIWEDDVRDKIKTKKEQNKNAEFSSLQI
ncbi:ADP-ribosyl cyclase/cyclic ADP-ribose hydrolase [Hirschfeldia incana]|nr:ADP-ribosyl cyclase/cyclic ADP-ribose hydrolase [Hirschfeldia incana]